MLLLHYVHSISFELVHYVTLEFSLGRISYQLSFLRCLIDCFCKVYWQKIIYNSQITIAYQLQFFHLVISLSSSLFSAPQQLFYNPQIFIIYVSCLQYDIHNMSSRSQENAGYQVAFLGDDHQELEEIFYIWSSGKFFYIHIQFLNSLNLHWKIKRILRSHEKVSQVQQVFLCYQWPLSIKNPSLF